MIGLIGLLLLVGLVVAYWQWIVVAVVIAAVAGSAPAAYRGWQAERSAERAQLRELITRADQQHRWAISGDPRGTYGEGT